MKTNKIFHLNLYALIVAMLITISASATDVGSPKGAFSVSPTGGGVYSVAIEAPTGLKEIQPNIAITYNSQSGQGIVGYGCNVSGISVITRAPKDIAHDLTAKGITFQNTDAFYIDGKRLLFQSGTEGAEGAVYTPEGEPFTEVIMHTSTYNSSPTIWFEARSCNGITYKYGTTISHSLFVYNNGAYYQNAWYISRVEDQTGNYMTFSYDHDHNFVYPSQIAYGYNNNGSGSSKTVNFTYEDEPNDQPSFYVKGIKVTKAKRLSNIRTASGSTTYRSYNLTYTNMTLGNRILSALSSINEKNGNNSQLPQMGLEWQSSSSYNQTISHPSVNLAQPYTSTTFGSLNFFAGDVNGDGFSDIIQFSPIIDSNGLEIDNCVLVYRSSFNKTFQYLSYQSPIACSLGQSFDFGNMARRFGMPSLFDFDGDGLNDILVPNMIVTNQGNTYYAHYRILYGEHIKSGSSSVPPALDLPLSTNKMHLYTTGDVDNDGKSNIVALERDVTGSGYLMRIVDSPDANGNYPYTNVSIPLPSAPQELFLADYNNNGLNDLMIVCGSSYTILWNQTGTGASNVFSSSSSTQGSTVSYKLHMEMGDFNGDGNPDFLLGSKESNVWHIAYGNGDGTFTKQSVGTFDIYDQTTDNDDDKMRCFVYDFNGDGRSDVVIEKAVYSGSSFSLTKTMWLQSSGTALSLVKTATSVKEDDGLASHYMLGDFTGDGRVELMNYGYDCYNGSYANVNPTLNMYTQSSFTEQSGKVTQITDGFGNQTTVTYKSLINSGKYTVQSGDTLPMADVSLPLNVVTKTVQTNGVANNITLNYEYEGLKAHLRGRGLLGFSKTKTIDQSTSDSTVISRVWDLQFFVPNITSTAIYRGGNNETSSSNLTIVAKGSGNYFAYPSTQTSTDMYGNVTTITREFNTTYGYMTSEKVANGASMYKKTAYTSYIKKGLVWLPQTITFTQKHSDDTDIYTDVATYTYNNIGLPTQKIIHQNVNSKSVTTNYTYDAIGNIISEISSGTGIPNITRYYTYDSNKRDITRIYTSPATTNVYYTYDTWGNVLTEQDRTNSSNYLTTTFTYDGWGRKTSETSPTGLVTNYSLGWGTSQARKYYRYEKTQGRSAHYIWYDACGREVLDSVRVLKGIPSTLITTYDSRGRVSEKKNSVGQVARTDNYTYDNWNRVTARNTNYEGNTIYTYGNRSIQSTKNGNVYTKTFDAWGNVKSSVDPISSVSYNYLSNGKPGTITSNGSTMTMEYDGVGNQTLLDDPDAGETTYTYNAAGQILTQTDARNITTQNTYDNLGRLSSVTVDGVATTYTYGTSGNEILRLTKEQRGNNTIDYTHDQYGRLSTVQRTVAGSDVLTYSYTYNSNDQISQVTYPGSVAVGYTYDDYGYRIGMSVNGNSVWSVPTHNGYNVITTLQGRNTTTYVDGAYRVNAKMEGNTRALTFIHSFTTGNMTSRMGVAGELVTENFTYDGIDRLTGVAIPTSSISSLSYLASITGEKLSDLLQRFAEPMERMSQSVERNAASVSSISASMSISYGANGNISSKSGLGNYTYPSTNATHPHAVKNVANTSNLISTAAQSISYTGFGKVSNISDNGYAMSFVYGPDFERWKTVLTQNGTTKRTTIYADNYEKITENGVTRQIYYLDDDVICMKVNSGSPVLYKGWTDNLGSYLQLIDNTGVSVFEAQYDAWGRQEVTKNNVGFHRGYTGHEMLPEFGLINMNGRLYDPLLGRFLSPDNYVQLPDFSQSLNRYSYCLNNPLKYTDPSGDFLLELGLGLLGAYMFGASVNKGELNPLKWDWKNEMTYFGIAFGAAVGAIGGYGIINPGTVSFGIGIDTPYLSLGTSIGVIGSGTDWNFDFHWTTAAGDGGSIKQIKGEKKLEEELNSFRNNARINYSAYSYAASSLAVLNDDWMGIGVYDDVIIPVVYGVATYNFYQDNKELFGKMWSEAESILSKHRRENSGFVYELHPYKTGMYKNYRTGQLEQLGPNDVWKIGQTTHGTDRYKKESYEFKNFQMVPIYWGTTTELLIMEKIYLYSYAFQHGHLPPGNRIFK
jgi:RHS repeat-associated protein